jgi:NADH-quinone oxidoreductase subunit G
MSTSTTKQLPKDIAAEKGMVNVQIDGRWIMVPKGTRMIEACKMAEQEVPHYCYHPKLSSPGNCRMCMVEMGMPPRPTPGQDPVYNEDGYQEIGWMPRTVIACANTVAENMGIRTKSEVVKKSRKTVLEFLLINHPLDCPICDKAGECRLQEFSVEHGQAESRFKEDKVKKPKNVKIGPRVRLDDERCIMCDRCIRFMDEVADDPVLGFYGRGTHTTVGVFPGRELDSNYSLNVTDLCPVGALTSNDFRFKMRTWFLKETPSIDTHCGTGINITIWTRGNKIFRITPRQNNDVNSCWMPDCHRLNYTCPTDDDRITACLIKADGVHEETCWNQAISNAADAIKQFEASEIAVVASGRQTNEELFMMRTLAAEIGTDHLGIVGRVKESDDMLIAADRNPNTTGAALILEQKDPTAGFAKIKEGIQSGAIKAVIVASEDLTGAAGLTQEEIDSLELLIAITPKTSATAKAADLVLAGAGPAEKSGTMVNITGRLQALNAACVPPGDARTDWEIITDLILALSGGTPDEAPASINALFDVIATSVDAFADLKLATLPAAGQVITETGVTIPLIEKENQRKQNGEIVG